MNFQDILLPVVSLVLLAVLLAPRIRANSFWQATVTPLASIIGSGFLIIAPLLGEIVGSITPWVMMLIVTFSYLIGGVLRFNIVHAEPLFAEGKQTSGLNFVEHLSNLSLFGAYITSVAFYLRLMSAFVLQGVGIFSETNANALTTAVLLFIGIMGWRRGLKGLETLEVYSVSIKLAIIGTLLLGLSIFDASTDLWASIPQPVDRPISEVLRMLAGMLLVVQGFETSRYLGEQYSADVRVRSMRVAQGLSAVIYVAFAFLILPLFHFLPPGHLDETAIINLSRHVSVALPFLLILAATMSQFSAAVADTLGGGGLFAEESRARFSPKSGYFLISICAIALIWSTSIFEIVAYASRAFAFYYFSQTILAFQITTAFPSGWKKGALLSGFGIVAAILAWVTLFAIPVE